MYKLLLGCDTCHQTTKHIKRFSRTPYPFYCLLKLQTTSRNYINTNTKSYQEHPITLTNILITYTQSIHLRSKQSPKFGHYISTMPGYALQGNASSTGGSSGGKKGGSGNKGSSKGSSGGSSGKGNNGGGSNQGGSGSYGGKGGGGSGRDSWEEAAREREMKP
ncbi:hypothetical protein F4803DRAFT_516233 [Xylaria telfairii]|nr:hypothetical protein F4803DRAFT_516233 [Xylaria telfairii]